MFDYTMFKKKVNEKEAGNLLMSKNTVVGISWMW